MSDDDSRRPGNSPQLRNAGGYLTRLAVLASLMCGPASVLAQGVDAPDLPQNRVLPSGRLPGSGAGASPAATTPDAAKTALQRIAPVVPPGISGRDLGQLIRRSATGLALPNAPIEADLNLAAARAAAWKSGETDTILLETDVQIAIGSYAFKADRAVVLISPKHVPGLDAKDVAIYCDHVTELGGYGPISQSAPRLLVTSVITGKVELTTALLRREPATGDPLVLAARDRMERYRTNLAANTTHLPPGEPLVPDAVFAERAMRRSELLPAPPALAAAPSTPGTPAVPGAPSQPGQPQAPAAPPEPRPAAQVDLHAGNIVYQQGDEESYILLLGGVQVMYVDPATKLRVNLTADKAVVFMDKGAGDATSRSVAASRVRGVYLEDNVLASDGQYTLRGPRIFYDLQTQRALVLDAVFFTWDVRNQVPLYVRARELRQHSRGSWSARDAKFTTSEFAEPHFAIGARTLTVKEEKTAAGEPTYRFTGEGITMNAGSLPVFYWPSATGTTEATPLQSIRVGGSSRRGGFVETRWDLFTLLSQEKPEGVNASVLLDGYSKRGPAVGLDADYDVENAYGMLDLYYLRDWGDDEPGGRSEVDPLADNRGRALFRHRHMLDDNWEATLKLGYLSDPTFLEEWLRPEAYAGPEYETSIYLKQAREDWAFSFLAKYDLNDFVAQSDLIQTRGTVGAPGYTVDKFPELAYYRLGTPLWDDRLTWYSENRASAMRLRLPKDAPFERGFNNAESLAIFGMTAGQHFDNFQESIGLDDDSRLRGDTRQEIQAPMKIGFVDFVPYVVGRVTAYDDDFQSYGGEDENIRFWGGGGIKLHTEFSREYAGVESALFDLHRLRHIAEPSVNILYADSTINQETLPVYDYDVESIAEGATVNLGLRNTLQTQRGGPGNWRSVDFLRVDTHFILASEERFAESPLTHFFQDRPEMNLGHDHVYNEVAWQVTDTFKVIADADHNLETHELERWDAGFTLDHTPRLSTFAGVRRIDDIDSLIVSYGFEYMMTPKYLVGVTHSIDIENSDTRGLTLSLTRRLPHWLLVFVFDFDNIEENTSVGIALVPEGTGRGRLERNPFLMK